MAIASPLLQLPTMSADLERIEAALRASVLTDDAFLTEMASHLILAGGKRIRPVMAVTSALTRHAAASDAVVMGGVSVELVHIGSLYHDDVMDEAETRRGVESVNARWGNLKAIIAGDFLLSRASEIAAGLGTEVAALLARTIGRLCEGQVLELRTTFDPSRTIDSYLQSITGKTASLLSAAARIGGIVADLPRASIDAVTDAALAYGMVFQIVDDVLDLTATEAELGKPSGHDLVEGVYTLPVLLTLAHGGVEAAELRSLLGSPISGPELDKALGIVRGGTGVIEALDVAKGYATRARELSLSLGDSAAAVALGASADALIASVTPR